MARPIHFASRTTQTGRGVKPEPKSPRRMIAALEFNELTGRTVGDKYEFVDSKEGGQVQTLREGTIIAVRYRTQVTVQRDENQEPVQVEDRGFVLSIRVIGPEDRTVNYFVSREQLVEAAAVV